MDFTKTPPSDYEVRNIIKFLTAENKSGAKIHRRFAVYGEEHVMNVQNVQRWQTMFKVGRKACMMKKKKADHTLKSMRR